MAVFILKEDIVIDAENGPAEKLFSKGTKVSGEIVEKYPELGDFPIQYLEVKDDDQIFSNPY